MMRLLFILCLLLPVPAMAGKVQEIKTPGGFTLWLMEEHSLPIVNMEVSFTGSGFAYDPAGKEGRSNFVASLLMEGAGERDSKRFNEVMEENAIRLNVVVDEDILEARLQTLSEHSELAFSLLADALVKPRFDKDAVERARAKMQALKLEQRESPYYKLSRGWQENIYGAHPYARDDIGTEASLKKLGADDFRFFMRHYISRQNIVISIVGDIAPAQATVLVDKYLKALPERYEPETTLADVAFPAEAGMVSIAHDIPQSIIAFGLEGMKRSDPDYIAAYVMNHILGGSGLGSRLADEIRVKRGLTYGIRTQLEPKAHAQQWRGMFSTRKEEAQNAIAVLKQTLETLVKNGVTQAELDDAKAYLTGSFMLGFSSNDDVVAFLNMMQIQKLGVDYLERRNAMVEQVTLGDIKRVSERLIDPARLRMVVVGNP